MNDKIKTIILIILEFIGLVWIILSLILGLIGLSAITGKF